MKALIEAYLVAYNTKDIPAMLALVDEQLIFEHVSNTTGLTQTTSKREFEALARQSIDYFLERKQVVRFWVVGPDSAAIELEYQATVGQNLPNGLKAGQQLHLRGVSVFEMKGGKLTRISDYS